MLLRWVLLIEISHNSLCYSDTTKLCFLCESQVLSVFHLQKFTEPDSVELCLGPENITVRKTTHSFIFWEQLATWNHTSLCDWDTTCYLSWPFLMNLIRLRMIPLFTCGKEGHWPIPFDLNLLTMPDTLSSFPCFVSWMINSVLWPLKTSQTQR